MSGPTCRHCADWAYGYAEGYAQGHASCLAAGRVQGAAEGPAHPAIADSVARMFAGWDGAEAAHARSAAHFRDWHTQARREVNVHGIAA